MAVRDATLMYVQDGLSLGARRWLTAGLDSGFHTPL